MCLIFRQALISRFILSILVGALLACGRVGGYPAWSQEPAGSRRFEAAIAAFEEGDRTQPPPRDATLFIGASNIRLWTTLADRFPPPVINRGFGGAHLGDVLQFADRIVIPYAPKSIYLNAGGNDLHSGKSPEQVAEAFQQFAEKVRRSLPDTKLAFLSIPPSPRRWLEVDEVRQANQNIADIAARYDRTEFIDIFSRLLGENGMPRADYYVADGLHFSERGYDVVTSAIRWQSAVRAIEERAARHPPPKEPILFIGSSSIVRWKSLADDFPDLPVVNHGFGGSEIFDSLTYVDRLVLPFRPRMIVMYAGSNDIHRRKSPERVAGDFREFVTRVRRALPETRVVYISIAPNPARWSEVEQVKAANQLIRSFAERDSLLTFVDVFPHMLGDDGLPKPDIFVDDRLHMNEKGYAIWQEVVGPTVRSRGATTKTD